MEPSSIQKTQNLAPRTEWLAVALSGSLLCIVVWLYPELFLFRKTVVLQAWARGLPYSLHAGAYLGFVVLLPVALLAKSKRRLLGWYLAIVAIATLPASLYHHLAHPDSPWQLIGNCTADLLYATLMILSGALLAALAIRLLRGSLCPQSR